MWEAYLIVVLPSLVVIFFALKGLTDAAVEWRGRKLPRRASTTISLLALILVAGLNYYVLYFLFFRH